MLIILGGLPGAGKSTIAKKLCQQLNAVYLRIDSIEQAIRNAQSINPNGLDEVFAEGYMSAYAVAKDNLEIGLTVVADSVNSINITRKDYQAVATSLNQPYFEIEIICTDKKEHQERVESRKPTIANHQLPNWQDVLNREYEKWETKNLTIDTSLLTVDEAVKVIIENLNNHQSQATLKIETERLIMRPIQEVDFDSIASLHSCPEVMAFFPSGTLSKAQTKERLKTFQSYFDTMNLPCFTILKKDSGEFVGRCGFGPIEEEVEVGYLVDKKFWGQGYATEVLSALLKWSKEHIKKSRIIALAPMHHQASFKVMEKCGMRPYKKDEAYGVTCKFYEFLNNGLT